MENNRLQKISNIWFTIILLELFLMGSGQLLKINIVTLRMALFGLTMLASVSYIIIHRPTLHKSVVFICGSFIGILILDSLIGLANGNDPVRVFTDVKPLLFVFMILPFAVFIKDENSFYLISRLIKISGIIMAILFIALLLGVYFGYVDFMSIYDFINSSDDDVNDSDIMFGTQESGRIFYKGFLYLNIACLFFIYSKKKSEKMISLLILTAIVLTSTRGFLLAIVIVLIVMALLEIKNRNSLILLISTSIIVISVLPFYLSFVGDTSESDNIRYMLMDQVIDALTIPSLFFGHGFGMGVSIRPDGMEITYFEVLHKQGLLGLFFWLYIFVVIIYRYSKIKVKKYKNIARPFVAGALFVYFQSLTNPYLNNPIGMSMVLITFLTLLVILQIEKNMLIK